MSATTAQLPSFGGLLHSEWIKLRSLRSTFWCYLAILIISVGLGALLATAFPDQGELPYAVRQGIWVQVATLGIGFSQLVAAVLGALMITGEYGTGMIRSTFTASPHRLPAITAKALVVGAATFVVGLVSIVAGALVAVPLLPAVDIHPDLGDARAWLSFLGGAGYLALVALLSFSIGAIIRNSAGGIAAALGLILVLPSVLLIFAEVTQTLWAQNLGRFLPNDAGARMYSYPSEIDTVQQTPTPSEIITLEPWQGLLVLLAWNIVLYAIAAVLTKRRDA